MIYVDDLFKTGRTAKWPYAEACHLTADTEDELHAFAATLGLKRSYFQPSPRHLDHYDLTRGKRIEAVAHGAKEITRTVVLEMIRARRAKRELTISNRDGSTTVVRDPPRPC